MYPQSFASGVSFDLIIQENSVKPLACVLRTAVVCLWLGVGGVSLYVCVLVNISALFFKSVYVSFICSCERVSSLV